MLRDNPRSTAQPSQYGRDRGQVSVRRDTYDKIAAAAKERGLSVPQFMDLHILKEPFELPAELAPPPADPADNERPAEEAPPKLEAAPAPFLCASCGNDRVGIPYRLPWGRDDALVDVCDPCVNDHPRSGNYNFKGTWTKAGGGFVQTGKPSNR